MSTTKDPAPSDNPGSTPGAIGGDQPGVDPAAIARGHEADGYDTASVVSVPLLVIGFFLTAFVVTTGVFWYATKREAADPNTHPEAAARNAEPLNTRLNRIYRGGEVDQPRLEPLVLREDGSQTYSRKPLAQGNSPQIHPEALRVSKENTPALYVAGWVDQGKKIARIPIDEAMKVALKDKDGVLKAAKTDTKPVESQFRPSAANAGRGAGESKVVAPGATPPKNDHKH